MTAQSISVGNVAAYNADDPTLDPDIVGASTQWSDDSDTTYATVYSKLADATYAGAVLGGPVSGATAITVTIRTNVDPDNDGALGMLLNVGFWTDEATLETQTGAQAGLSLFAETPGITEEQTFSLAPEDFNDGFNLATLAAAITANTAVISFLVQPPESSIWTNAATIYEVTMSAEVNTRRRAPSCRKYPRAPDRRYPPPSTRQAGRLNGPY